MAYEMVVTAYAEGERKALKQLLSREVYDGFISAIGQRESRGEVMEFKFVGIDKAEITDAAAKSETAHVTVKFQSKLISATYDSAGKVIDGDPIHVSDVTDIWTFAREVSSRDPNWKLVATESVE
jgi:predicted lipid-binding transport protein (Tim44 family)